MALKKKKKIRRSFLPKRFDTRYMGEEPVFVADKMPVGSERILEKANAYNWYNYFCDSTENFPWVIKYLEEKNYINIDIIKKTNSDNILSSVQRLIRMYFQGWVLSSDEKERIINNINDIVNNSSKKITLVSTTNNNIIVNNKPSQMIIWLDSLEDAWINGNFEPIKNADLLAKQRLFNENKKTLNDVVHNWLTTRYNEFNNITKEHNYGYSHLFDNNCRVDLKQIIKRLLDDLNVILSSKKKRKPRAKKLITVERMVEKLKFQSEYNNIKSIDSTAIIGAKILWVYNTKYKIVTQFVSNNDKGFGCKGTTLQNVDNGASFKYRLRKPDEALRSILCNGKRNINNIFKALTTKRLPVENSRINKNTILLKVL